MRIKKAVDIHKVCFEIPLLFPNQGDTLSYFLYLGRIIVPMALLLLFVLL